MSAVIKYEAEVKIVDETERIYNTLCKGTDAVIFPFPHSTKKIAVQGWSTKQFTLQDFAEYKGEYNIAFRPGSSFFVIDIDCTAQDQRPAKLWQECIEEAMFEDFEPRLVSWTSDKAPNRKQVLFKTPDDLSHWSELFSKKHIKTADGISLDLLTTNGACSILPPSVHEETKQPYRWIVAPWDKDALITDPPPCLLYKLKELYLQPDLSTKEITPLDEIEDAVLEAIAWLEVERVIKQIERCNLDDGRIEFLRSKITRIMRFTDLKPSIPELIMDAIESNSTFYYKHIKQAKSLICWSNKVQTWRDEAKHYCINELPDLLYEAGKEQPEIAAKHLLALYKMQPSSKLATYIRQLHKLHTHGKKTALL